ncbi:MAG: pyridoxamine 5'-phosphate oxidase family protein [Bacilli bacterium]|nr:pyridoxamine 5'-phosphate oxidase family protein [Bacilli bacterium]
MNQNIAIETALEVIKTNNFALIGTVNQMGNPNIKALVKINNDGLKKFYFNTQSNSVKVSQMKNHKEGCVYFFDGMQHIGVLLEGEFNIIDNVDAGISEIYQAVETGKFDLCTVEFTPKTLSLYKDYDTEVVDL